MNYTFQFGDVFAAWPLLVKGTWSTVQLSLLAVTRQEIDQLRKVAASMAGRSSILS